MNHLTLSTCFRGSDLAEHSPTASAVEYARKELIHPNLSATEDVISLSHDPVAQRFFHDGERICCAFRWRNV